MASVINVRGKWKSVEIDPNIYQDDNFGNFISMEEVTDYEIIGDIKLDKGSLRVSSLPIRYIYNIAHTPIDRTEAYMTEARSIW